MRELRSIARHSLLAISFLALFLLLNRPEIILLSRLGYVVWYPAVGLVLALMLGVSPWYAPLVCLSTVIAGKLFYNQPLATFGETIGALGGTGCYAAAAYVLRRSLTNRFRPATPARCGPLRFYNDNCRTRVNRNRGSESGC